MRAWGEAKAWAMTRLATGADPSTAALDAEVLLAFALDVTKEELLAHPERRLAPEDDARFAALVARRQAGEPVAYLRGFKEFFGIRLHVDPRVLIPRPETETLVEEALRFIGRTTGDVTVVDVGTGSGAIACAIALHARHARVIATDASADALAVAQANAKALAVADRIAFRQGDLLAPVTERVDVVCANLPYLRDDELASLVAERTSLAYEPRIAVVAGSEGLDVIERAVEDLPRVLAPNGAAFFECDPPQANTLAALMERAGLVTRVVRDLASNERVVTGALSGAGRR
jgi:release factor glutamine methyltransferase